MDDHYETLGIPKDATTEQIKKAYRKKVKQVHPDQNPDIDPEEIKRVNQAYEVFANPSKRERYDKGEDVGVDNTDAEINEILASLFLKEVSADHRHRDVFANMRSSLSDMVKDIKKEIGKRQSKREMFLGAKSRVTCSSGENFFEKVIDSNIRDLTDQIAQGNKHIENLESARTKLDVYKYAYEPASRPGWQSGNIIFDRGMFESLMSK